MTEIPDSMGEELAALLSTAGTWEATIAKAAALDTLFAIKVLELRGYEEDVIGPWAIEHLKLRRLTEQQYGAAVRLVRFVLTGSAGDLDEWEAMLRDENDGV